MAAAGPSGGGKPSFKEQLRREREEAAQAHARAQALEAEKIKKMAQAVVRTQTLGSVVEAEAARSAARVAEARKPKSAPPAAPPAPEAVAEDSKPKTQSFLQARGEWCG